MSRSDDMKNALAQAYADLVAEISLHDGDPADTGLNDLDPTVPHAAITWPTPPDSGVITSSPGSFTVPDGTVITNVGMWDGSGNYLDSFIYNLTTDATSLNISIRFTEN